MCLGWCVPRPWGVFGKCARHCNQRSVHPKCHALVHAVLRMWVGVVGVCTVNASWTVLDGALRA